jgi:heat shock protein HslJ
MRSFPLFLFAAILFAILIAGCTTNPVQPVQQTPVPTLPAAQSPAQTTIPTQPVLTTPATSPLLGTWYLREILFQGASTPLDATDTQITATFDNKGQASGYGGCNNYGGPYTITGQVLPTGTGISIGPVTSTMMYCVDSSNTETLYLKILGSAVSYTVFPDQRMVITDNLGNSLSFGRTPYVSPTSVPSF